MKRKSRGGHEGAAGPSQRQLRAAELVRHALVEIVQREELRDPALRGVYVTIGEVRASPDLKHMTAFVSSLGPGNPQGLPARAARQEHRASLHARTALPAGHFLRRSASHR
jgi:ribosome-binding factor A